MGGGGQKQVLVCVLSLYKIKARAAGRGRLQTWRPVWMCQGVSGHRGDSGCAYKPWLVVMGRCLCTSPSDSFDPPGGTHVLLVLSRPLYITALLLLLAAWEQAYSRVRHSLAHLGALALPRR